MQPSDGFWDGFGQAVGTSPGWMVIGALLVVGVLFVVAKYIYPGHKELKMRELDIRQKEAENAAEDIRARQALAEQMRGTRESVDALAMQNAAMTARIEESKSHSREMGETVSAIDVTTRHTDTLVEDIHRHFIGGEGTD